MSRPRLLRALALAVGFAAAAGLGLWARIELTRLPAEIESFYRTPEGDPLFHSADAFYHLRHSRRLIGGGPEDQTATRAGDPTDWDRLSFAPEGRAAVPSLLQPLQAWAWRWWPGRASLATVAFYLPAAGSLLLLAIVLWIACRFGGVRAGIAAALLAAAHPELVSHTHAGMADTTYLSLALYALAIALLVPLTDALKQRAWPRVAIGSLALAAVLALFAATWAGWWAAALTALAFLAPASVAALWPGARRRVRGLLLAAGAGGAAAVAAGLLVTGAGARLARYTGFKSLGIFPDGASQVQELASLSPTQMLSHLGGWPLLVLAVLAVLWMLALRGRRRAAALLLLWALPAVAAGFYALRFAVFAVPALAVAAGWAAARLAATVTARVPSAARAGLATAATLALALAAGGGWKGELELLSARRPAIDRAFAEVADAIADRSPPAALVNSWWDHGYALTQLSGRGAVIDGGSYQSQRLYWLSLALTAEDEALSHNLLRAIDCGVEVEMYRLLRVEFQPERAVGLIRRSLRREGVDEVVRELLANGTRPDTAHRIHQLLDCGPPPAWLVVSSDLAAKTTSWATFGRWRFDGEDPEPAPMIAASVPCRLVAGELSCANGYSAGLERDGFADRSISGHFAAVGPERPDGLVPVLHQHGRGLLLTFVRRELIDSLYSRLYYFHGRGAEHFRLEQVAHHPPHTQKVLLYRIEW